MSQAAYYATNFVIAAALWAYVLCIAAMALGFICMIAHDLQS